MAKMKSKSQLAEKDVREMIRNYWETLESDRESNESLNGNPVARNRVRVKVKQ